MAMLTAARIRRAASPVSVDRSMVYASPSAISVLTLENRTLLAMWNAAGASMPRLMIAISPVAAPMKV